MPLALTGVLVAAAPQAATPDDVIAQSGAMQLSGAEIRTLVARLPDQEQTTLASNREALERSVRAELVKRMLLAEARSKDLEHDPEATAQIDHLRDEVLVRLWISRQTVVPSGYPSEADIKAAYTINAQTLAPPTEYHLAQILVALADGAAGDTVAVALRKTADISAALTHSDFAQVAQSHSDEPLSAAKGGDLGFLPETKLLPSVAALIRAMTAGAVAGPVKISQGFVFVKLIEKKSPPAPTLAQAHAQLLQALRTRRTAELQQTYLAQLDERLGITVNQTALTQLQRSLPVRAP